MTLNDAGSVYRRSYRRGRSAYRALVVGQPWAWLIARGEKMVEVRSWTTPYRGPLVIVGAARPATPPAGMPICVVVVRPVSSYGKLAFRSSRGSDHTLAIESQVRRGCAAFANYTTYG
jgi:ASCH domain